ncbi:unnamed protein product [marine sediment metagenome]|uniref:Uncharacterized protein n=1 Tax=marine sediment metagenome TaxID=412755 RepID=X1IVX3_9ZZZZ
MKEEMVVQGRRISINDIRLICELIDKNPSWKRTKISKELCKKWNWYTPYGQMKDMACRTLLLKLESLGDARRRGETHQWMYDRINLKAKLINLGYKEVLVQEYNTSLIPNLTEYGLDVDENGNQYKPESLYIEATK